jgi:endonuclease/exonuclease/phosphatase family metal-dependent hydrolase
MKLAFIFRAKQARTVAEHIKKCPYPIIVCGDFNDTPLSYTYQILSEQLNDAFSEAGFGISNTYNGFLPLFRIDYVLHSERFKAISYQSEKVAMSDHFPVVAILEWLR